MPNIAQTFKEEISRLARREVRKECLALNNQLRALRVTIGTQKKAIEQLVKTISQLKPRTTDQSAPKETKASNEEEKTQVRLTASSIKRLRQKLGISQVQMGRLLAVSANTIIRWEAGSYTPRERHKLALAELRNNGKREINKRLEEASPAS